MPGFSESSALGEGPERLELSLPERDLELVANLAVAPLDREHELPIDSPDSHLDTLVDGEIALVDLDCLTPLDDGRNVAEKEFSLDLGGHRLKLADP